MSKKKKGVKPNQTIVELLKKIKVPIYDKTHNLNIYFKEKSKSNETGIEHAAKSYHGLQPSDVEMLVKGISNTENNKEFQSSLQHRPQLLLYLLLRM